MIYAYGFGIEKHGNVDTVECKPSRRINTGFGKIGISAFECVVHVEGVIASTKNKKHHSFISSIFLFPQYVFEDVFVVVFYDDDDDDNVVVLVVVHCTHSTVQL